MPPDLLRLLRLYGGCARPLISQWFLSPSCIASTAITIDVMAHYGFRAEPFSVGVVITRGPFKLAIGVDPPSTPDGLGGHIVATVDDQYLVDAAFGQVHNPIPRPGLPQVFLGDLMNPMPGRAYHYAVNGWQVRYFAKPPARDYTLSPDWGPSPERQAAVSAIVAAIDRGAAA